MMASRGMGAISPSKMPKGKKTARRDDTDFTQYSGGGDVEEQPSTEKEQPKTQFDFKPTGVNLSKQQQNAGGRFSATKQLSNDSSLQAYLDANLEKRSGQTPSTKVTGLGVKYTKTFAEGGKVNAAGNYTKPSLRKRIVSQVKAAATQGTGAGQWSARKAQLVAKKYKAAGGGYKN
jgi:hypothetical protein